MQRVTLKHNHKQIMAAFAKQAAEEAAKQAANKKAAKQAAEEAAQKADEEAKRRGETARKLLVNRWKNRR